MRGLAAFLSLLLSAGPAHAYLKAGPVGYGHWLQGTATQQGMTTSLAAAYSFRKVRDAYAGSAVKLRRTTGGTQDIGFTAGGDFDTAAAATFCLATTCFIDTWYDQSGNARNATQATAANQPQYIADCGGGLPCAEITTTTQRLDSPAITWASAIQTMSVVGNRTVGTGRCYFAFKTGGYFSAPPLANNWNVTDFVGEFYMAAADAAWHAGVAVISGASSLGRIDATEMAGASIAGSSAVSGVAVAVGEGAGTTCREREALIWNNYALTAAERQALTANQIAYWLPLPLDGYPAPKVAFGFRKLLSSYTGPAVHLRRASDSAETDINFLGFVPGIGAPLDIVAANTFCAATNCYVYYIYNQGTAGDIAVNWTPADQPLFVASCQNGNPCMRFINGQQLASGSAITFASPINTMSVVAKRTSGTGQCFWLRKGDTVGADTTAGTWFLYDFVNYIPKTGVTENVWHVAMAAINGAASVFRVDASETTGTMPGFAGSTTVYWHGAAATSCDWAEGIIWDSTAFSPAQRAALQANQQGFWGTP